MIVEAINKSSGMIVGTVKLVKDGKANFSVPTGALAISLFSNDKNTIAVFQKTVPNLDTWGDFSIQLETKEPVSKYQGYTGASSNGAYTSYGVGTGTDSVSHVPRNGAGSDATIQISCTSC